MKYLLYVENNEITGAGCVEQLGENIKNIEVSKDVYDNFVQDKLLYVFRDEKIIENPDYEIERQKCSIRQRITNLEQELKDLDLKRIRAVCEDEIKDEKTNQTWLDYYNAKIYDLRVELNSLTAQL